MHRTLQVSTAHSDSYLCMQAVLYTRKNALHNICVVDSLCPMDGSTRRLYKIMQTCTRLNKPNSYSCTDLIEHYVQTHGEHKR